MKQKINKDDYLSISKFAKISGISRKNLIYYDTIGVFSPEITLDNGYRFYYYRQLYTISMICTLKDIGVPLKEIKKYTENRSPNKLIELFESKLENVNIEINRLLQTHDMMTMHIDTLHTALNVKTDVIEVKYFNEEPIFVSKNLTMIEGQKTTFSKMLTLFFQYAHSQGYHASFPWGIKLNLQDYKENTNLDAYHSSSDMKNGLSFYYRIPVSDTYKPSGKYIVLYIYGHDYGFNRRNTAYQQIVNYAKRHNYKIKKELYEDYLINEISGNNPDNYLIRLSVPIKQ